MNARTLPVPSTLAEAHEILRRARPRLNESRHHWAEFHRRCAEVYAKVAKIDLRHRHEAAHWAGAELRRARDLENDHPAR